MATHAPHSKKTEQLRRIFDAVAGDSPSTFVERQQSRRGTLPTEVEVDAVLARIVAGMRERYAFATDLPDAELVRVVRGFYADRSDGTIAADLGVDAGTVADARLDLHLLREDDASPPADPADLRDRFDAGEDDATVAADLGVDEAGVRRYRCVLATAREASSVNHRYQTDFESVLAASTLEDALRTSLAGDRRVFDAVKY